MVGALAVFQESIELISAEIICTLKVLRAFAAAENMNFETMLRSE